MSNAQARPPSNPLESLAFAALGLVLTFGLLISLIAAVAGALFGDGWRWTSLAALPEVVSRLPEHTADPRLAWPPEWHHALPGPIAFYATAAMLTASLGCCVALLRTRLKEQAAVAGARWARRQDVAALVVKQPTSGRLTLGVHGRRLLAAEPRQSVIAVAPTQSGKTTGLAIPAILEWDGPVIATSVKTDLIVETLDSRRGRGQVQVFDPAGVTRLPDTASWTPLASCKSWQGARRTAGWLTEGAAASKRGLSDGDFWYAAAAKLLAPLLFAAASSGCTMRDVVAWIDTQQEDPVLDALEAAGSPEALNAMQANVSRDERQRSSIYTTAEIVLEAYADPGVLANSMRPEIRGEQFLGGPNTLYLSATVREQRRLRPVLVTLLQEIVELAYAQAARGERPARGLLIVLDEAANVAPLPDLDVLAATAAGQGIQLLTIVQDLAQAQERWGRERAETIVNNHRAKIIGPGISDTRTLEVVGRLLGDEQVTQRASTSGDGRRSTTTSEAWRALAPPNALRQSPEGSAVLIYGTLPPARIRLRPWFLDRRLRQLAVSPSGSAPVDAPRCDR